MKSNTLPVTVSILDKEYRISCQPDERESLLQAAAYVDGQMREIRQAGRIIGTERIAVMTALNIANDLLLSQRTKEDGSQNISRRIKTLQEKIEIALNSTNQMEL
ncbi:MAG: cell division protein ZapA [Candidatus Thiodiazotropha lotti]|uniref:Cell division protein ZapA n=1 Tax=Candidatus Thiodiazotropha endoloripes TaxID=1818881 RepID=A0A1E2UM42_9GAMM|nr:cell division protein ZapA [Candidatus Thiodiazotropha endoloripes]MCG7899102.1 cell division protein ZapA [Candidatus Thiodiazotropha weberae]MCG7991875.1 cell division protein ZapA [Candidatus Thiodiazotropha lotti]MCG7901913.1 cell division protein ZapA [Candidatus Thiodiazotropha weberae]MCG7912995.1 cell division protein ZapA [Candidatus Thiodiazotropha weberae]MCG7998379.1 cell division protein ZapA [Candidatus Thiodiazotropha lotti]